MIPVATGSPMTPSAWELQGVRGPKAPRAQTPLSKARCSNPPEKAPPTPSRMPATGRTETGSISDLPIFCRNPNARLPRLAFGAGAVAVSVVMARSPSSPSDRRCRSGLVVVVGRDQRSDRRRGVPGERLGGQVLALGEGQGPDLGLDGRDGGDADAQLIH